MKNKLGKILPITISLLVAGVSIIIFPLILVVGTTFDKNFSSSSTKPQFQPEKKYKYNLFYLENNKLISNEFKTNNSFEELVELLNNSNNKFTFDNKEILLSNFLKLEYIGNNENFDIENPLYSFNFQEKIITFREPNKTLEELNNIKKSNNVFHINESKSIYNSKYIKNDIYKYNTPLDFDDKRVAHREKTFFNNIDILKNKTAEEIVNQKLINNKFIFDNINLFVKGKHNITIDKINFITIYINELNGRKGFAFGFEIKENSVYHDGILTSLKRRRIDYNIF